MMNTNNFEIIWPEELAVNYSNSVESATIQPQEEAPVSEVESDGSAAGIFLVCGAIVVAGVAFARFNDRNARDTAELKEENQLSAREWINDEDMG